MVRVVFALLALVVTAGLTLRFPPHRPNYPAPAFTTQCEAVDGDTLRCEGMIIGLLGVDAAEMQDPCPSGRDCAQGDPIAQWAELGLFVARGKMIVQPVRNDKQGTLLALVKNNEGRNASCAALRAGARYLAERDYQWRIRALCLQESLIL